MAILVYLRFSLIQTADLRDFEGDLRAMAERAQDQPGYVWSETAPSMDQASVYIVISEWDQIEDVRSWEHDPIHVEVQHKWERYFRDPLVHRRFVPWERPAQT